MYVRWSEQEIAFIEENRFSMNHKEMARELFLQLGTIRTSKAVSRALQAKRLVRTAEERNEMLLQLGRKSKKITNVQKLFPGASPFTIVYLGSQYRITRKNSPAAIKKQPLEVIAEDIAIVFHISVEQLKKKSHAGNIPFCRFLFCYVAKKIYPTMSLQKIGQAVGYTNHATVIHAISQIKDGLTSIDPYFWKHWHHYYKNTSVFVAGKARMLTTQH